MEFFYSIYFFFENFGLNLLIIFLQIFKVYLDKLIEIEEIKYVVFEKGNYNGYSMIMM